jgi:hypothetical protein
MALRRHILAVIPLAMNLCAVARGAEPEGTPGTTSLELEEVQVIGRKLVNLQRELVAVQDRFYTVYNDLNRNDDFDVFCRFEAQTGTQVRKWKCQVAFLQDAIAVQAQQMFLGWTSASANSRAYVNTPEEQWLARRDEYRENVRSVALASPELRELAVKWQQLQERYDKAIKGRR